MAAAAAAAAAAVVCKSVWWLCESEIPVSTREKRGGFFRSSEDGSDGGYDNESVLVAV